VTEKGRWTEVRSLFEELVELSPADRQSRLAAVPDRDLSERVRKLLAADSEAGRFLEMPAVAVAGGLFDGLPGVTDEAPPPQRIGPYRVLGRLGRGGMGEVLLAERADGLFDQRVAIKLLRGGMASDEILARFSRERRILARLEHPHIARLLDGGATDDGRPYFVMELVEGEPITDYCRSRSLAVEPRLELLQDCCDAVAAAHRNLVVHRDLKPSNVLVTKSGEVKLLDFGIAKLLGPEDTGEAAAETRTEFRLLTPAYAAPEQILGEPVTTATDVWALGALGYELLTGTLPQKREGRGTALAAAASEDVKEKPSQRVAREELAALPLASPTEGDRRRLERRLRGDLDNILLASLRREPERRYGSVTALAGDLRRHRDGQPIKARADTFGYRFSKFVRRNRVGVAAAVLVLASLVTGLAVAAWQARRAAANAKTAAAAARRAEAVKEFLIGLFEVADPEQASGGSVTASELLDQAGKRLETELASEPDIQADLLEAVARIDKGLGRLEPAEGLAKRSLEIRERAFPPGDATIGRSLATLGAVKMSKGELEEGEKQLSRALAILEAKEGPDSLTLARAKSDYGQVLFWKGESARAEKNERGVYETYRRVLGDDNALTATHLRNLAVLLDELDRLDESEKAYRDSQAVLTKRLGPDHANLGSSYANLAVLLGRRGKPQEAEALYKRSLEIRRKTLGPNHPMLGQTLQLTALFYLNQGRLEESEATYGEALALFRAINPKHFEIGKCNNGLALIASRRGDYAKAEKTLEEVEVLFREVLGEKHPFTWQVRGNRASQIGLQGRLEEAEAIEREVAAKLEELNGKDSGEAVDARVRLAETVRKRGRWPEALPIHREALGVVVKMEGESSTWAAMIRFQVAADLLAAERPEDRAEARALLDRALAVLEKQSPPPQRIAEVRAARAAL
jgi:eukaryotic-like serine/threonine-protein kinase